MKSIATLGIGLPITVAFWIGIQSAVNAWGPGTTFLAALGVSGASLVGYLLFGDGT